MAVTCCYQLFKFIILVMTLVSFGIGYLKFYQLFVDIVDTIKDIDNSNTFSDFAWIPYLIVQICTTVFVIIQVYCLVRELCEDNYMYKYCFKCCFILTILIYCLSVLPKSVVNLIYHNYDVSIEDWWAKLVDALDSLLAGLTTLGFQIILYMTVIRRTLRSAGACKGRIVAPSELSSKVGYTSDDVETRGCCLAGAFCCSGGSPSSGSDDAVENGCAQEARKTSVDEGQNRTETDQRNKSEAQADGNDRDSAFTGKSKTTIRKGREMIRKIENKKNDLKDKVNNQKNKFKNDIDEVKCKTVVRVNDKINEKKEEIKAKTVDGVAQDRLCCRNCICCPVLRKGKGVVNRFLEERTTCFIITMTLANIHFFVYIVEFIFIVCWVC